MKSWTTRPMLLATLVVGVLLVTAYLVSTRQGQRTVTAHFDRAVAVYPGTDLRVMGVRIGEVTAVVPDGDSVRVEMRYDSQYALPADAGAAVVTPTLVADRYVQVFPAYGGGRKLEDGGDIPLARTQTPVELDRMYKALDDLSTALGPQPGTKGDASASDGRGALASLLDAGARALDGNGEAGAQAIRNLSAVAETLADNRGPLFDDVEALASISETLAANDTTVEAFIKDLSGVSEQLAGERQELGKVLKSLAEALDTVKDFIHQNRAVLGTNIDSVASLLERVDRQKDALGLVAQKGALAMGNLALAFEPSTGTYGSRVQVAPGLMFRPDQFICQTVTQTAGISLNQLCDVLGTLFGDQTPIGTTPSQSGGQATDGQSSTGLVPNPVEAPASRLTDWRDLLKGADR